jgi:hypothetical protein
MYRARGTANRPQILTKSISDYALRDHALGVQSFPRQELFVSTPVYFCVHCGNGFEKRGDWETHEWIFHERQSYWPCPHSGCDAVFDSGKSFEAHHEAMHRCHGCKHSAECVRLLPERKVWACGFDGCKAVFLDWSKRCKHVASHYEGLSRRHGSTRETPEWKYTTTVRNLLRQPDTRETFKRFMTKCHGHSKTGWPTLEWQRDNSAELKRCLEYRDFPFPNGIQDIIQQAYRLGHPAHKAAVQVMSRPPTPPADEVGPSSLSPDFAYFGSTGPRARSQRSYLYERKSSNGSSAREFHATAVEPKQYRLPTSLPTSPPSMSPPYTRNTSPDRAPSFTSEATSFSSNRTGRKRMIAREAEVKNTSCNALADFLRDGPPGSRGRTVDRETEVKNTSRNTPADFLNDGPPGPRVKIAREAEVRNTSRNTLVEFLNDGPPGSRVKVAREAEVKNTSRNTLVNFLNDGPPDPTPFQQHRARQVPLPRRVISPYSEYVDDRSNLPWPVWQVRPEITIAEPQEDQAHEDQTLAAQIQEDGIRETVLEWPQSAPFSEGTRVLPPTPGPPPMQAPPKPPGPPTLSPITLSPLNLSPHNISSGSLVSTFDATGFSWSSDDPPPSPMPPGFSDMEWPLPPTPADEVSASDSTPTPTAGFFKSRNQTHNPTPGSFSIPELSPASHDIEFPKGLALDRPRTAHGGLRIEVPKLMAAPPKRSKSTHRSGKHGSRWKSISSIIEPPLPSPGIDFGFCLSQPLDLVGSPIISSR